MALRYFLRSFRAIRAGASNHDKFLIFLNRVLHGIYPLNVLSCKYFGRPLLEPSDLIHGYKCRIWNMDLEVPGGNSEQAFLEDWEPSVKKILGNVQSGDVVDIGSSWGIYSLMLGRKLSGKGRVVAIEPNQNYYRYLLRNIALHKTSNVQALNMACWSENTTLSLSPHVSGYTKMDSSVSTNLKQGGYPVEAKPLDDILKDLSITNLTLVKIDVEGAESHVLSGMQKTLKGNDLTIIFEVENNNSLIKCTNFLAKFGYEVDRLPDGNYIAKKA